MSEKVICSHCHQENDNDDIFCIKCGHKLTSKDITTVVLGIKNKVEDIKKEFTSNKQNNAPPKETAPVAPQPPQKPPVVPVPPKQPEIRIDYGNDYNTLRAWLIVVSVLLVAIIIGALIWWYNVYLPETNKIRDHYYGYTYVYEIPTPTPSPTPTRTPTPTPTRKPTSSIVGKTCRINDPGANVRSGPGTNYNRVGQAPQGHWYKILSCTLSDDTGNDWYKINMDGTICWISSTLVELDGNTSGTINGKPISNSNNNSNSNTVSIIGETCYIFDDGNNVRSGPGTNYSIIGQVNSGASFKIYDYEICTTGKKPRDWYKIYFNGQYGWISSGIVELHGHRDGTAYGVRVYD